MFVRSSVTDLVTTGNWNSHISLGPLTIDLFFMSVFIGRDNNRICVGWVGKGGGGGMGFRVPV